MTIMAARPSPATTPPADAVVPQRGTGAPAPGTEIPSHYRYCYGCGVDHGSGLHMKLFAGEGLTLRGEFTVSEQQQGAPGLAHGGLLGAAFDEVMGAANWLLMAPAVTARLEVDFAAPVPVGQTLYLRAEVLAVQGRKVYTVASGCLGEPGGLLATTARGLFLQVPLEHFASHGSPDQVARAAQDKAGNPSRPWLEINP